VKQSAEGAKRSRVEGQPKAAESMLLLPVPTLVLVLLAVLIIDAALVRYMLVAPSTGIQLTARDDAVVVRSAPPQYQPQLAPGTRVSALGVDGQRLALEAGDLIEEPDLHADYPAYNRFLQRQQSLFEILVMPQFWFETATGERVVVTPGERRLAWLPLGFCLQLLVASVAVTTGVALWLFRRGDRAALHYMLSGLFLAVVIFPAAVYSSRELALPADVFRVLSVIDHLGLYLVMAAVIALLWTYPEPVAKAPIPTVMYVLMGLSWVLDSAQWFPSLDVSTRVIPLLMLLLGIIILVLHWRRSRGDTLYRQAIKWFLMLIVAGCGLFIMIVFFPPLIGYPPLVSQSFAFLAFLSIYLGLAIGVTRYRLFELDRWWFEVWYWLALGGLLFVLEVALVSWLSLSRINALALALVVIAWMYFPLRQRLFSRLLGHRSRTIEDFLPLIVREISGIARPEDTRCAYQQCLSSIYSPLSIREHQDNVPHPVILQNGLSLVCPQPTGQGAIELHCADQGRQLFSGADVNMVAALVDLFTQAHESRSERNRLIQQERERIKQDMHDTLGGRLLSIMRLQGEPRSAQLATSAWRELRDILTALEGAPVMLSQALDQWHRDTRRQMEGEGVELRWQVDDALREQALQLNGFQRLNLGQILREGLSNALRHSSPRLIEVYYGWRNDQLCFELCNDGVSLAPQQWTTGRGLHHIRQRAAKLGASVDWSMRDASRVGLSIAMPLRGDAG